jgi:cytidylate kinase
MKKKDKIVISGLTAAGKTTHAKLLAEELGLPFYSASDLLRSLASERYEVCGDWGDRWSPRFDELRSNSNLDDEIDLRMLQLYQQSSSGVFDSCFLPWLSIERDGVNIWIESDLPSRVRKCFVSHLDNSRIDLEEASRIVTDKDAFTIAALERSVNAKYEPDDRFDLVVSNTDLMPQATVSSAVRGVAIFAPVLYECIGYLTGRSATVTTPSRANILRLS